MVTLTGNGYHGDFNLTINTWLKTPYSVAVDAAVNKYITDSIN